MTSLADTATCTCRECACVRACLQECVRVRVCKVFTSKVYKHAGTCLSSSVIAKNGMEYMSHSYYNSWASRMSHSGVDWEQDGSWANVLANKCDLIESRQSLPVALPLRQAGLKVTFWQAKKWRMVHNQGSCLQYFILKHFKPALIVCHSTTRPAKMCSSSMKLASRG